MGLTGIANYVRDFTSTIELFGKRTEPIDYASTIAPIELRTTKSLKQKTALVEHQNSAVNRAVYTARGQKCESACGRTDAHGTRRIENENAQEAEQTLKSTETQKMSADARAEPQIQKKSENKNVNGKKQIEIV